MVGRSGYPLSAPGCIKVKDVGDVGPAADMLDKITAFTIQDRNRDSVRLIGVGEHNLRKKKRINVVWEWIRSDSHTSESWVKSQLNTRRIEMTLTTAQPE